MSGHSLRQVFAIPLVLQILTIVGLVSALLGDGLWDAVSWAALSVLPLVLVRCLWRT